MSCLAMRLKRRALSLNAPWLGQDRYITIGCLIEARNEAHMTDNAADLRAEIDALKERVARLEKELAQLKMKQERAELQRRQR